MNCNKKRRCGKVIITLLVFTCMTILTANSGYAENRKKVLGKFKEVKVQLVDLMEKTAELEALCEKNERNYKVNLKALKEIRKEYQNKKADNKKTADEIDEIWKFIKLDYKAMAKAFKAYKKSSGEARNDTAALMKALRK